MTRALFGTIQCFNYFFYTDTSKQKTSETDKYNKDMSNNIFETFYFADLQMEWIMEAINCHFLLNFSLSK